MSMKNNKMKSNYILAGILMIVTLVSANSKNIQQEETIWKAPASADKLVNKYKDVKEAVFEGKKIFNAQCAICHGETGEGNGIAGAGLTPRPSNLISDLVQQQSDGAIFWKITNGRPPMASYKKIYTEKQRWQLVNYIRSLREEN